MTVEHPVDQLAAARQAAEDDLLFSVFSQAEMAIAGTDSYGLENVVGVGITERTIAGRPTGVDAVAVYVTHKVPPSQLDASAAIPEAYEGVPTDVIETGEFVATTARGRHRPAMSGISIGHHSEGAGTLGFIAEKDGHACVVSNNHVLALLNAAQPGDAILQPGRLDGGSDPDRLGELGEWVELDFSGGPNLVDAALAYAEPQDLGDDIYDYGPFDSHPVPAQRDQLVRKSGRSTGVTRGIVSDDQATIKVRYRSGAAVLREQILVKGLDGTSFSEYGDSGSLVIEEAGRRPVGLLCAGSSKHTVMNRIDRVLEVLGVSFAT